MKARLDCSEFPRPLLLTDTATGMTTQIEAPSGANGFFAGGAFSPDRVSLAAFVATSHPAIVNPADELAIVDINAGTLDGTRSAGVSRRRIPCSTCRTSGRCRILPNSRSCGVEHMFDTVGSMPDLPTPEEVEYQRRGVAMLAVGQPALNRNQALRVLQQLHDAVADIRRRDGGPPVAP